MSDLNWLNGLEGKTNDIALALYQTSLTDAEIASKYDSTLGYVQKVRSTMRRHGFVFEKRSQIRPQSGKDETTVEVKQAEKMLNERITREDLRKLYADFKAGISLPEIAVKHGWPPDLLMSMWRGWLQMKGRDKIVRLCELYGDRGVIQFHKIGEYLKLHNQSPKQLVDLLHSIGSLQQYQSGLQTEIHVLEDDRKIAKEVLDEINGKIGLGEKDLGIILKNLESSQEELTTIRTRVNKLKDTESRTKQSINELLNDGYNHANDIAADVASSIPIDDDRELREKAVGDLFDTIVNYPENALSVLEAIAKCVEENLPKEEFIQKYAPLLQKCRERIRERFRAKVQKEVITRFHIPVLSENVKGYNP